MTSISFRSPLPCLCPKPFFAPSSQSSAQQVMSRPTLQPVNFKEVDHFMCRHTGMKSEITALYANSTWSLVPFDPLR